MVARDGGECGVCADDNALEFGGGVVGRGVGWGFGVGGRGVGIPPGVAGDEIAHR